MSFTVEDFLSAIEPPDPDCQIGDDRHPTDAVLDRIDECFDDIADCLLWLHYERRAPSYFGPIARRLRVIDAGFLLDLLDDAVDESQLTGDERDEILRADLVMSGRRRQDSQEVYLLAELSVGVGPHDVERAVERAALLAKLGKPVLPIVAGKSITDQAAALAREHHVWYVEGGHVTAQRLIPSCRRHRPGAPRQLTSCAPAGPDRAVRTVVARKFDVG